MATIESTLSPHGEAFQANRAHMLELLERVRGCEQRAAATSERSRERFEKRGQLLPRERLSLLLDPGTPFLELCSLAGLGLDNPDLDKSVPGGGVIAGIGQVSGLRVMVNPSDSGIDAGALQPMGIPKQLRIQELALENRLPYVQLVESAGANLMTYKVEEFVTGGSLFRNLARLSAAGLPVLTVTHGSSTAGGAYQTGLSDYIVMVRDRSRAFLAGPPLLKAATGEIATEEELGGALMHSSVSGLGDYLAEDDRDAIRIAREILAAETAMGLAGRVEPGPADSAIFAVENGQSIADDMARAGVRWVAGEKGPGSRRTGLERVRRMLKAAAASPREEPGLFFFDTCRHSLRTLPALPRDDRKPDDVDTEAEDHVYDALRYRAMAPRASASWAARPW